MTFWQAYRASWRGSVAFIAAMPLLAAVPVVVELIQHGAEVRLGMYDSLAAAKAADDHPVRMAFGFVKVLALVLPGYWATRFLAWDDPRRAASAEPQAVRLFAGVLAFQAVLAAVELFVLPRTGAVLGVELLVGEVIGCLLPAWGAAAALGNAVIGPAASVRIMARRLPSSFLLLLLAMLPLMVLHYAFATAALVGPRALLWPVLIVDSLVVGWLAAMLAASAWFVAQRGCAAAGVELAP